MSDNQDLKSKILLMRQKNFGEVINESNEKNDNEKPKNAEIKRVLSSFYFFYLSRAYHIFSTNLI